MKFSPIAVALFLTGTSTWFCIDAASVSPQTPQHDWETKQGQEAGLEKGELKAKHEEGGGFFTEPMGILPEKATKHSIPSFDQKKSAKLSGELKVGKDSSGLHLVENQHKEGRILQDVIQQIGVDIDGEFAGDYSGHSVSMSNNGKRVAVGAPYNDGNGASSGHVRIYEWNDVSWNQIGGDINGEAPGDQSGRSVSMSGDGKRVAIGAPYNDGNGGINSGHVRIYEWNDDSWNQIGGDIDGEAASDGLGWSVSISNDGKWVAMGAVYHEANLGHVRIYEWNDLSWNQIGGDIDGEGTGVDGPANGDYSGWSVSMSDDGTRVAIGAHGNGIIWTGHVRIYERNDVSWNQIGGDIDGEAVNDQSGMSVSMSGDGKRVAIGAHRNGANGIDSGHVRIYEWNDDSWNQIGGDIDGEAASDVSGWSVSMSNDGKRVAIGAYGNDDNGAENSGHVRIYEWNDVSWNQIGGDIDGEAASDGSGYSVSMSNDGRRVAVGAYGNDGSGANDSGHVRVYELPPTAISWEITSPEDWTVDFTADPEIVGIYTVTKGQAWRALVLSKDCELSSALNNSDTGSPIKLNVVGDTTTTVNQDSLHGTTSNGTIALGVDIDPELIQGSSYWTQISGTYMYYMGFCVRLDLETLGPDGNMMGIIFHLNKMQFIVDMTSGFEIEGVNLELDNATITDENVTLSYEINTYHCPNGDIQNSTTWVPAVKEAYTPQDELKVCFSVPSSDVIPKTIANFALQQVDEGGRVASMLMIDEVNSQAILGGTLAAYECDASASKCMIQTAILTAFFDDIDEVTNKPFDLKGFGDVVLEFVGDGTNPTRHLQALTSFIESRASQGVANNGLESSAKFEVTVGLAGNTIDNGDADHASSAARMPVVAGIYFLLGGIAFALMM